ncbi:hypothetical protein ANCDUO_19285 [Ancylostoma duodenale]|uniref:Uncharacterized protein n=1 Tax=Ancylostoma duodenale TaxID=51022 RepID=A0A0C2FVC1_9BILA|nr:hypothetical protein ANCDUO_19285 [Ancylostoma duodenale]
MSSSNKKLQIKFCKSVTVSSHSAGVRYESGLAASQPGATRCFKEFLEKAREDFKQRWENPAQKIHGNSGKALKGPSFSRKDVALYINFGDF